MAKKTMKELTAIRKSWLDKNHPYKMLHYSLFNYNVLDNVFYHKKSGKNNQDSYNDIVIMFDTETSKSKVNTTYYKYKTVNDRRIKQLKYNSVNNYVVAWSICLYALDRPIVTLWGHRPSELVDCIDLITTHMKGRQTYIYARNLQYDWTFCRQFFMKRWGIPVRQLNTKSHNPILIEFTIIQFPI